MFVDIFKQNRLIIVINKIDEAVKDEFDEQQYTREEVVSIVQNHLCSKVFKCSLKELPPDVVIPVSGLNALHARLYKKRPNEIIEKKMRNIISTTSSSPFSEYPKESIGDVVENMSNIRVLEERLVL